MIGKVPFKIVLILDIPLVSANENAWKKCQLLGQSEQKLTWAVARPSLTTNTAVARPSCITNTAVARPSCNSPSGYTNGLDYQKEIYNPVAWVMPDALG